MRFVRYQLPAFIWGSGIFVSSSLPSASLPKLEFFGLDKLVHVAVFSLFAVFTHRAIKFQDRYPLLSTNNLLLTVIITVVYGVIDELHQYFVPGREVSISDILADLLGSILYVAIASMKARRSARVRQNSALK